MKKSPALLLGLLFLAGSCSCPSTKEDQIIVQLKALSEDVKQSHAPDRRSRTFEVNFLADTLTKGVYIAKGATTQIEAKEALAAAAVKMGITLLDSIKLLPDPELGAKIYGITSLAVSNIRYAPGHTGELATQTLMGMPMRILERRGSWVRVITPEGYIGWSNNAVQALTKEEYDEWIKADKVIITTHYTLFREEPSAAAAVVRDGVWGCIVVTAGAQGGFYKVILPDGKPAFVAKAEAQKYSDWLKQRNPTAAHLIATGRQFVGFPYLWGGTSIKALDCSGFVKTCFYLNGVIIPRDASQQAKAGIEVNISDVDNLQPADLLFFGTSTERISHVGMYIGNGKFIHSNASWASVAIESLIPGESDYTSTAQSLVCARRYITVIDVDKEIVSIAKHTWYNEAKLSRTH